MCRCSGDKLLEWRALSPGINRGCYIGNVFIPRQDDLTTHLKRAFLAMCSHWQHRQEMGAYFGVTGRLTEMGACPEGAGPLRAWQKGLLVFIKQLLEISWQPQLKSTEFPGQSHSSAAVNIGVHVFFPIMVFSGYMLRRGIARSYGSINFSFLKSLHTVLHSGYTNWHSH